MLQHLYHLLLGAIAGFIVGILPSLVVGMLRNGAYAIGVLTSCVLIGAIMGVILGKNIELFFDGLFELLTIE